MPEPTDLESRLTGALHARSNDVEPADDSFCRLKQRVEAKAHPQPARFPVNPRYLAAAAVLVVAIGSATVLMRQGEKSSIEAIGPPATSQPSSITTVPPASDAFTDDAPPVTTTTEQAREYVPAAAAGPREPTVEAAALAFLEMLQVDHAGIELVDSVDGELRVDVRRYTESREVGDVAVWLALVETEISKGKPGFMVTQAFTDSVTITSPAVGSDHMISPLVVAGEASGVDGDVAVALVSASNGSLLASSFASAGTSEKEPYTATLEVAGAERGWIVVSSGGDADNVMASFAAVPISYIVGQHQIEYAVHNISADDPDGGLQLRDLPGTEVGEVLVTIPPETVRIRRQGRVPALIDHQVWWNVLVTIDEELYTGWVNSSYLRDPNEVVPIDVNDDELSEMARRFTELGIVRDIEGLKNLPWATTGQIELGWVGAPQPFAAVDLRSNEFWNASFDWVMPGEAGDPLVNLSLLSLQELPDPAVADVGYELDADISPYGNQGDYIAKRFPGARTITIFNAQPDTPWRTTTLVVLPTVDGARIVSVVTTVWIP